MTSFSLVEFSGNWCHGCRVLSVSEEKNNECSKSVLRRTCEMLKGPWKLMGVEQDGLGLRAQRGAVM